MELQLIEWLMRQKSDDLRIELGIGDDAAVAHFDRSVVMTTDLLAEGVHFHLSEVEPERIGRKAMGANLSDIAAMAAQPRVALVSLCLPQHHAPQQNAPQHQALELAKRLYTGIFDLAREFQVVVSGGDTNCWTGPLVINIVLLGETTEHPPLRRVGARAGDWLMVTGQLGGSILGRQFSFPPRIPEALALNAQFDLHAGLDISDGLLLDLSRLLAASHCGAVLESEAIPVAPDAYRLAESTPGQSAWEHAVSDGEDFELLLAVPPDEGARMVREQPLEVSLTKIGECIEPHGMWLERAGKREAIKARGYTHG